MPLPARREASLSVPRSARPGKAPHDLHPACPGRNGADLGPECAGCGRTARPHLGALLPGTAAEEDASAGKFAEVASHQAQKHHAQEATLAMMARFCAYVEKVFHFSSLLKT